MREGTTEIQRRSKGKPRTWTRLSKATSTSSHTRHTQQVHQRQRAKMKRPWNSWGSRVERRVYSRRQQDALQPKTHQDKDGTCASNTGRVESGQEKNAQTLKKMRSLNSQCDQEHGRQVKD